MDLLSIGKQLLGDKLGDNAGGLMEALSGLSGEGKGLDLGGLVEKAKSAGLGDQVGSWLGDGENSAISADQVKSMFSEDQLTEAAAKMGVDTDTAAQQIGENMPDVVDKASSGGSILDQFGGISGALNMAKGLLSK